jgi:hypothetical protein
MVLIIILGEFYYYPKNVKKNWFIKIKKFKTNLKFYCMKKAPNYT